VSAKRCPDTHTLCPEGYLAWHEWAERKAKTHECTQCPECFLWGIWVRKVKSGVTA
jgi:hypothetical protein